MLSVYVFCAVAGFTFLLVSLVMGHGHGQADGGDAHADDAEHVDHADGAHDSLPFLGTGPLSALLCGFGIGGTVGMVLGLPWLVSLLPAAVVGGGMWGGSAWMIRSIVRLANAGRSVRADGFVGEQATVTVTIPVSGLGEVTFTSQGEVAVAPARSANGTAFSSGTVVTIEDMQEGVAVVGPAVDQVLEGERQSDRARAAAARVNDVKR